MQALILVDIQNDFLPAGALAVPDGQEVIAVANRAQAHFELVVATQDWHPANHRSFATNHPGHQVGDTIEWQGLKQTLWPVHCVQGTRGAEFAAELEHDRWTEVFRKGLDVDVDSYSGFFDNGHRRATGLGEFLRNRSVDHVAILGLATDYCVKYTALDARQLGFETTVLEAGCRGVNLQPSDVPRAISEMRAAGIRVQETLELDGD